MADCQTFRDEVNRLAGLLADQDRECAEIDDPRELRLCRQIRAQIADRLSRARQALAICESGLPSAGVQRAEGHLSFLRVHDSGGFGPQTDFLDAEVIFRLDTQPNRAFGFQLRNDASRPSREAMLGLLRDAFEHDFSVATDYRQVANKANSIAFRIELTDPGDLRPGGVSVSRAGEP
jgi:hypothetical protein